MTDPTGTVALVTGAAAGIGAAVARDLAAGSARVVLVDVDPSVREVAGRLGGVSVVADLADTEALERIVDGVVASEGRLDVLVNNAGLARHNAVADTRTEDLDLMWAVNARALILLCRDAYRAMRDQGGGQIVNVVSTAGLQGGPGEAAYCATKFAVRGFTQGLAEEGRLDGVRVHGVYPAGVDTAFWAGATADGPGVDQHGRFLTVDDVSRAVLHALAQPPHVHVPELVLRAMADADLEGIERKLGWFRT